MKLHFFAIRVYVRKVQDDSGSKDGRNVQVIECGSMIFTIFQFFHIYSQIHHFHRPFAEEPTHPPALADGAVNDPWISMVFHGSLKQDLGLQNQNPPRGPQKNTCTEYYRIKGAVV